MKLEDYKKYHEYNVQKVVPALRKAGLIEEARKVEGCGEYVKMYKCKRCNALHFQGFQRCKSKYCALCNFTKYLIWFRRLYEFFETWLNSGGYCCLLTLTCRDGADLTERLSVLNGAWRSLTSDLYRARFRSRFAGGLKSLEVKLGDGSAEWHPHFHVLVLKKTAERDIEWLRFAWKMSLLSAGDSLYDPQVDIRAVKYRAGYQSSDHRKDSLRHACLEVLKYSVKFGDFDQSPDKLPELVESLKGKRQVDCFGLMRNLKAEIDSEVAAFRHEDLCFEVEKTCKVCGCTELELEQHYYSILDRTSVLDSPVRKVETFGEWAVVHASRQIMREIANETIPTGVQLRLDDFDL